MKSKSAARLAWAGLTAGAILALAGPAAATATPDTSQRIFSDLADNGRLDGHYTRAQINRALHSPSLRGYDRPQPVRKLTSAPPRPSLPSASADGPLPFSALDFALFAAVGGPLLLLGGSVGRLARVRMNAN
jgi:hypothetical protein